MTIDAADNLYLGDNEFSTGYLRKITPDGTVTTICGNGSDTTVNLTGSCGASAVWVNVGLTASPLGIIYYISGTQLFSIQNSASTMN